MTFWMDTFALAANGCRMIDVAIFRAVVQHRISALDPVMLMLSHRGFLGAICIIWAIALVRIRPRRKGRFAFVVLAISIGLSSLASSQILKPWADRPRPCSVDKNIALTEVCDSGKSMPSNHAVTLGAGAAVVMFFLSRRGRVIALPILFLVGFSRVYLGVHYPSDVIVGTAFGFAMAALVLALWTFMGTRFCLVSSVPPSFPGKPS